MTRAVVILGAGASADFGVPTLANIFKDRHARTYLRNNPRLIGMLRDVFWDPRGHDLESSDQSISVEQMLTILKDWEQEDSVPDESKPQDVPAFRKSLYVLIQKAVFDGKSTKGQHLNPLIRFCSRQFEHTTWASFNWDCVFEASFWYSQPYEGAYSRQNPSLAITIDNWSSGDWRHTFLKLHGGINWWLIGDKITYLQWTAGGELAQKWAAYDRDPSMQDRPVILEPSFYKYGDTTYRQLEPQWKVFLQEMLRADCILIIGYSFPEMDVNARSKILTAFQVNDTARWLVVDPSEVVCGRYRTLLGHTRVHVLQMTLAGFNNDLDAHVQEAFPLLQLP